MMQTGSTLQPSVFEDIGGGCGGEGSLEPLVQLGDVGTGGDPLALLVGHRDSPGVDDLEQVLGLALLKPFLKPFLASLPVEAFDEVENSLVGSSRPCGSTMMTSTGAPLAASETTTTASVTARSSSTARAGFCRISSMGASWVTEGMQSGYARIERGASKHADKNSTRKYDLISGKVVPLLRDGFVGLPPAEKELGAPTTSRRRAVTEPVAGPLPW
jgi:hypothetical protein